MRGRRSKGATSTVACASDSEALWPLRAKADNDECPAIAKPATIEDLPTRPAPAPDVSRDPR